MAYSSVLLGGATNGSPTWARLITEQWLLLRSQSGSFSFICVKYRFFHFSRLYFTVHSRMAIVYGVYPAGISGSVVVLWSYFPIPANTYQEQIRERIQYELCCKYLREVAISNQGNPHNNGRNNAGLNQTATKTTDQTRSLIVPLSTSWLVSSHSPSTFHARWVWLLFMVSQEGEHFQNPSVKDLSQNQALSAHM